MNLFTVQSKTPPFHNILFSFLATLGALSHRRDSLLDSLGSAGGIKGAALADVLGPGVGQDEVLDAEFGLGKDALIKVNGDVTGVADDGGGIVGGAAGSIGEGGGRVVGAARLVVDNEAGGILKDALQLAEVGRRQVNLELGAGGADEVEVDVQGTLEHLARGGLDRAGKRLFILAAAAAVLVGGPGSGDAVGKLPVADAHEEGDVLAREILEGRELLEGLGVLLKGVLEGIHGQDGAARAGTDRRRAAGHARGPGGARDLRVQGLCVLGAEALARLPAGNGLEGLLAQVAGLADLPDGDKNGEDLEEHYGDGYPHGRDEVVVDRGHTRDVQSNEPHGGGVKTGDAATHGLKPPALGVVDVARAVENDGRNDPSPEELPKDGRPPLPAATLLVGTLHRGATDLSAGDTEGVMELAGDEEHEDSQADVQAHADADGGQGLVAVVELLPPDLDGLAEGDAAGTASEDAVGLGSVLGVLLLGVGDVEESGVGGVEEGYTERQPDTHDPVLSLLGHQRSVDVARRDA